MLTALLIRRRAMSVMGIINLPTSISVSSLELGLSALLLSVVDQALQSPVVRNPLLVFGPEPNDDTPSSLQAVL